MQQSNQEEEDNTMYAVTTVTDNDDDVPESTTASANNTALLEQEDRLRIAAEKRRQKILNQANTRMSIVEGTYSSSISTPVVNTTTEGTGVTTKTDDEDVVPVTDTDGTEPLVVGESSTDTSTTEAVTSSSTTTSSKLAAMRRRRFQKKAAPTATEEEPDTTTVLAHTTTTTIASSTTTTSIGDDPKSTTTTTTEIEDTGAATEPMMDTPLVTGTTERVTEPGTDDVLTTTTTTNKKYLGVAKMRRRMIKERHEQQQQQDGNTTLEDVAGSDTTSTISSHPQTRRTKWITTLPILTYVMTTFVLFGTGLHVGLQQSNVQYCYYNSKVMMVPDPDHEPSADGYCYNTNDDESQQQWSLLVHSEFAPRQPMGGLHRLSSMVVGPVQSIPIRNVPVDAAAVSSQPQQPDHDDAEDEFSSSTVPTVQKMQSNNIDPLFQVDLDALTTGDGLYFTLGRFAVRVHRFILSIVLDLPKSILQSVLSFVWSFVQTPPVFFLMAVLIRHGLGKVVLGAKLPAAVVDDAAHKDILSTVQTFATKFVLSSFPTLKIVYDVWTHIRSDMYVILCGLFVGWAVSHSHLAGSPYGDAITSRSDGATTTLNGISDEL